MKIYRYVMRDDTGFAPNPFGLHCTLTACKPKIRCVAEAGDWIFARGSKAKNLHSSLIYAMQIDEVLTLDAYYNDLRFQYKKPQRDGSPFGHCGDNIYFLNKSGYYQQDANAGYHTLQKDLDKDVAGKYALSSSIYYYFGRQAVSIPPNWISLFPPRTGHRVKDDYRLPSLVEWLQSSFPLGLNALPLDYYSPEKPNLILLSQKMKTP